MVFYLNELSLQITLYLILSHVFMYRKLTRMFQRKDDSFCVEVLSFRKECAGTEVCDNTLHLMEGISMSMELTILRI
jgi:hypothetical protein